jgi:phosphatidylinositol dimannoside acyltransferase
MSRALTSLRAGTVATRLVPFDALVGLAERVGGAAGPRLLPAKTDQLRRNLERVLATGPDRDPASEGAGASELARRGIGSYTRYWAESLRLPTLPTERIDRAFSFEGYAHIERCLARGIGPIIVLPHLGGWEWAAAWLTRVMGVRVTAVVERLEPEEVYRWFVDLRSSYGIDVVPLGPGALGAVTRAIRRGDVVCLVADRDIGGTGAEVEFFGERTSLPVGPAWLARRTGAPLLPTGVYFRGRQRVGVVTPPIEAGPGRARDEIERLTREVAERLEFLIRQAPEQWHVLEPNWPADRPGRSDGDGSEVASTPAG